MSPRTFKGVWRLIFLESGPISRMAGTPNQIASKIPLVPRSISVVVVVPALVPTVTATGEDAVLGPASVTVDVPKEQVSGNRDGSSPPVGIPVPDTDTQLSVVGDIVTPLGPRNVAFVVCDDPAETFTDVAVGGTVTERGVLCVGPVPVTASTAVTATWYVPEAVVLVTLTVTAAVPPPAVMVVGLTVQVPARGENVASSIHHLAIHLFGRHVKHRAHDLAGMR